MIVPAPYAVEMIFVAAFNEPAGPFAEAFEADRTAVHGMKEVPVCLLSIDPVLVELFIFKFQDHIF